MESSPKVLIVIPTHAHPTTLPLSIRSALNQTYKNIEILVIGDGVSNDTRLVMAEVVSANPQVNFLDNPKAIRHGEEYRDMAIRDSDADFIGYLGDDDLLFPTHLEVMLELISDVDFANPLPIFIAPDGALEYLAADLGEGDSLAWHLSENPLRNSVSLTGVVHSRLSYLRLPFGWRPAPSGIPTDLHMWHQYFLLPEFKARTASISTTAKFADATRKTMTSQDRAYELSEFLKGLESSVFISQWNLRVQEAIKNTAIANELLVARLQLENKVLNQTIDTIHKSLSWRTTDPLRKLLSFFIR